MIRFLLGSLLLSATVLGGGAPSFRPLSGVNGEPSGAYEISDDGRVMVGACSDAGFIARACRWVDNGSAQFLGGELPGWTSTSPEHVSADGSVIAGLAFSATSLAVFRWEVGKYEVIPGLPGSNVSLAGELSADGQVLVGYSNYLTGRNEAWRWTSSGGTIGLGEIPGGFSSSILLALSDDGEIAGGASHVAAPPPTGSREAPALWRNGAGGGWSLFSGPLLTSASGFVEALSGDGTAAVGGIGDGEGNVRAFYWTAGDGAMLLPTVEPQPLVFGASDLSSDGSTVVGANGLNALIWREDLGTRILEEYAREELGLPLTGWTLWDARGVSGDGRRIVGTGTNPDGFNQGWVLDLGSPLLLGDMNCDGVLSVGDIAGFVLALTDPAGYAAQYPDCDLQRADMNQNGAVSVADIGAFVAVLTGG